ncbi:MAG: hypothetical protein ACRDK9_08995 [Solirubrobacterales bacterium]
MNGLAQPKIIVVRIGFLALAGAAVALALGAALADSAAAQQPAICDQYPQLPQCGGSEGAGGGGGGDEGNPLDQGQSPASDEGAGAGPGAFPGAGGPTAGAGGGTGGELPFTGYPLTPLLLILLILLAAGLMIRTYLGARDRWRLRHHDPPSATV